ncbi:MAG: hypothetical protein ABI604_10840, partial [Nitrospirota bacterium]
VAGVRLSFMASTIDTRGHFTMVYQGGRYQMHETIRASHVWVGARGWAQANHAPGAAARRSRDHVSAREDRGGCTEPPTPAPGHAEARSSVAPTPAAGATNTGDGGGNITRTLLLGPDTSPFGAGLLKAFQRH